MLFVHVVTRTTCDKWCLTEVSHVGCKGPHNRQGETGYHQYINTLPGLWPPTVRQSYDVISSSQLQNRSNCIYLGGFLGLFQSLIKGEIECVISFFTISSIGKDLIFPVLDKYRYWLVLPFRRAV